MEKIKLKIKGMHCTSCSSLIESELKHKKGVVMPKVNHESGKAVVVFDKNLISEKEIIAEIEKAGDYKVEKMEEDVPAEPEEEAEQKETTSEKGDNKFFASPMLFGFLVGAASLSIIINVILMAYLFVT